MSTDKQDRPALSMREGGVDKTPDALAQSIARLTIRPGDALRAMDDGTVQKVVPTP